MWAILEASSPSIVWFWQDACRIILTSDTLASAADDFPCIKMDLIESVEYSMRENYPKYIVNEPLICQGKFPIEIHYKTIFMLRLQEFFFSEINVFSKMNGWHNIPTFEDWKTEILKDLADD